MARSIYIYTVAHTDGTFVGAWTVKRELFTWLTTNPGSYSIHRRWDGQPWRTSVALDPDTLEEVKA